MKPRSTNGVIAANRIELLNLIEQVSLKATEEKWCVQADHCIARIVYDKVAGQKWQLAVKPPFYLNATEELIEKSIEILKQLDKETAVELNRQSLKLRGGLEVF